MRTAAKQQFTQQGCPDKNLLADDFSLTFVISVHPFPATSASECQPCETLSNSKPPGGHTTTVLRTVLDSGTQQAHAAA